MIEAEQTGSRAEARRRRERETGRLADALTAEAGQPERQQGAERLDDEDDTERGGPAARQPTDKVTAAPDERRRETEDDGRERAGREKIQRGQPAAATWAASSGTSGASSSRAVGPGSSTMASATAS